VLVVVDMQNDFCHPKGWFGQKGIGVKPRCASPSRPAPPAAGLACGRRHGAVAQLGRAARPAEPAADGAVQGQAHVPTAWATPNVRPRTVAARWCLATGARRWWTNWRGEPEDITVFKHRLSGFWDNELDSMLRLQGATTLLFAGVNTDRCVFSTLQDAGFLGYDCRAAGGRLQHAQSPAYVTRAIHFLVHSQLHGFTARSATCAALLAALARPDRRPCPALG
jgi:ureidoacrylate peracid hydrolase